MSNEHMIACDFAKGCGGDKTLSRIMFCLDGVDVGVMSISDGKLSFDGNLDESAIALFQSVAVIYSAEYSAARRKIDELKHWLTEFGSHHVSCYKAHFNESKCSCGFDKLIRTEGDADDHD